MRDGMFRRVLMASLRKRASRVGVAALAVLLGASLVTALASLSFDVGGKAGRELRAYGSNITLSPRTTTAQTGVAGMEFGAVEERRYLAEADLLALTSQRFAGELMGTAPFLYSVVEAGERKVALAGVRFADIRQVSPWWQVTGEWASDQSYADGPIQAMAGAKAAATLGLATGGKFVVRTDGRELDLWVAGVVETGAVEDSQIFIPLPAAQYLFGKPGLVSVVQVSAVAEQRPLAAIAADIESAVPGSRARLVGQIAEAEATVLDKVRLLVGLVAALVLVAAGLAVGSTMSASVLERTREIGLMKALGAEGTRIALLFLAEAGGIAFAGGLAGYAVGLGLAAVIGQVVFGAPVVPNPLAAPLTLGVALAVCLLASILPVRSAIAVDPATTLRGE